MADVMSRLLTGGGGVDGISSTTTISGTSRKYQVEKVINGDI
jgi:hypothetical protein